MKRNPHSLTHTEKQLTVYSSVLSHHKNWPGLMGLVICRGKILWIRVLSLCLQSYRLGDPITRTSKMVQYVKALSPKPDNLNSIPGTLYWKENPLLQVVYVHECMCNHKLINNCLKQWKKRETQGFNIVSHLKCY